MRNTKILVTGASGDLGRSMIYYLHRFNYFKIIAVDADATNLCVPQTLKRYLIPKATSTDYINVLNKIIVREKIDIILFLYFPDCNSTYFLR